MIKRTLLAGVLVAATATFAVAQQPATIVLKSGERVSGTLTYKGTASVDLNVNGQDRMIPFDDIAIVAFVPGDPSAAELGQLPQTDNVPELQRHMIVLRNGQTVKGKLWGFGPDGNTVTIDEDPSGQRREYNSSDVARVYLSGTGARSVYNNVLSNGAAPVPVATSGQAAGQTVIVNANQPWTATNVTVKKGDRLAFMTTGQVQVAPGAAATPDGFAGDTGSRSAYPVSTMPAGGLIARVGTSAPFPIGANTQPITMPEDGALWLGVNDNNFGDNSGAFSVVITRASR
jgi:hypothetical protein